jgi:predicted ATPase
MQLRNLIVRNFRALEEIDCELGPHVNVIVGPNAVGKSTVLQAIRLTKALLAPRTSSEQNQTLISLGAASPHFPQRLFLNGLAFDPSRSIEVHCTYLISAGEVVQLRHALPQIVQNIVASRAGQAFTNSAALIQYLQSPAGVSAIKSTTPEITSYIDNLVSSGNLTLGVTINGQLGMITASDPVAGPIVAFLDQMLPPHLTKFSFFPADRALPMGEVQMQIGAADISQQLESHSSQPQLKYNRLKHTIVNAMIIQEQDRESVRSEFEKIFTKLLRGRRINKIGVNELGLLSILTEDLTTGRLIELDNLSSGEKNIALTFLLIAKSSAKNGVILFDEPELHLNPAVCRDVLPFIIEEYAKPLSIQFIMCTHSPEILESAFGRDDCTLLHLLSAKSVSKVGRQALDEYASAMQKLGTSVSESMFYAGTILVEGVDDIAFLETAFPLLARKYKLSERGGRKEIEKTIEKIQELEKAGERVAPMYVIHDRDDDVGSLNSSAAVKILAWPRYCLENFLIDLDVITELLKDRSITNSPVETQGEVHRRVKDLAFSQLDALAARIVYNSYGYVNASLQKDDVAEKSLVEIAHSLYSRMSIARDSLSRSDFNSWSTTFQSDCARERAKLESEWQAKWREVCDGKRLLSQLHRSSDLRMSEKVFKLKIAQGMKDAQSENWRIVRDLLASHLGLAGI